MESKTSIFYKGLHFLPLPVYAASFYFTFPLPSTLQQHSPPSPPRFLNMTESFKSLFLPKVFGNTVFQPLSFGRFITHSHHSGLSLEVFSKSSSLTILDYLLPWLSRTKVEHLLFCILTLFFFITLDIILNYSVFVYFISIPYSFLYISYNVIHEDRDYVYFSHCSLPCPCFST